MDSNTLTKKLHDQSDAALNKRLDGIFEAARREFADGSTKPIKVGGGYVQGESNMDKVFIVDGHKALSALQCLAFDMQRDKCRDEAVNQFMSRVDSLGEEIDELRNNINRD